MDILQQFIRNRNLKYEIAINVSSLGEFSITEGMCEELHLDFKTQSDFFNKDRANPVLIELIKEYSPRDIEIVKIALEDIPRAYLKNYDGYEIITYSNEDNSFPLMDYLYSER